MAAVGSDAGDIQRPPGIGAQMAIGEFWPSISESEIQRVADTHRAAETRVSGYGDTLKRKRSTSPDLLQGQAGDARVERLSMMMRHAYDVADHVESKVATAESYKATVVGLKLTLTQIGDAAQTAWVQAQKAKKPFNVAPYKAEATAALSTALGDIAQAPPVTPLNNEFGDGSATPLDRKSQNDEPTREKDDTGVKETASGEKSPDNASKSGQIDQNNSEASPMQGATLESKETGQVDSQMSEAPAASLSNPGQVETQPALGAPMTGAPTMATSLPPSGMTSAGSGMGGMRSPQVPSGLSSLSLKPWIGDFVLSVA